ncbi:FAD:protein FMN transferase [Ponticaulis sp.]|uniref:FAD:protein FMN transferase n=1 Tax=Ponticaulis sp. TaxID=2020902 RepID=UPI000B71FFDF|nr:FAD:protein FMN transferase [Ponticaulis sp.]MAI91040.1 hypothetical protein [Ponticaulis sp.]OUX98374.1 MAG: hypothetical protein CBB65_11385 [Hyphomonadaceae bacterium TMED5]|tara:strand:- start:98164 stop:99066 length:903 start_codon:yes stop_codon:yes gene_type:complete
MHVPNEAAVSEALSGHTMGTNWSARFYPSENSGGVDFNAAFDTIFAEMISELSTWDPDSFISKLNRAQPGERFQAPAHFRAVWEKACDFASMTGGAFTPFALPRLAETGFGPDGFDFAQEWTTDWSSCREMMDENGVIERPDSVLLDLSAVAKGYSVDLMAECLRAHGVSAFMVEIGGEFMTAGLKADRQPWWIDLESHAMGDHRVRLALCGQALATSGILHQSEFSGSGVKSHIVGANTTDMTKSVSVMADSCMLADGWATALMAAGENAMELANQHGIAAIFQARSGVEFSQAAEALL